MINVELKKDVKDFEVECGDFLILENREIRMVCEDDDEGFFAMDLSGQVQTGFCDDVDGVVEFYTDFNKITRVIKSENMKLVEV